MNRLKRGFWVVFEGIDGVGKSTLMDLVFKEFELRGYSIVRTGEPGSTPLGKNIRQLLDFDQDRPIPLAEYLLFAADRAQHMANVVIPAIKDKKILFCDRSADSSLAYQGFGRGVDRELIKFVNAQAMQNTFPNRIFYLKLSPDDALRRREQRGGVVPSFELEQKSFFERVALGFDTIFADRDNVTILDAEQSPKDLLQKVCDQLLSDLRDMHE